MATFDYQALTSEGRLMKGTLEAPTIEQARGQLAEMHLTIHSITKVAAPILPSRIGRSEFLLFNQQLASIAKAGIPLEAGLRQVAADVEGASMRRMVASLADDLEAGMGVEEAFTKRQAMFPPLYGLIVKAGVKTGRLSEMLTSLNRHIEMGNQTRRILFEAMAYPVVVLCLAAILMTGVMLLMMPPFQALFAEMRTALPLVTQLFLYASHHVFQFWVVLAAIVVCLVALSAVLSSFTAGRRFKESLQLAVPVLGKVYHRSLLSRLADAMALLIGAGVDLPEALRLGAGATGSELIKAQAEKLAGELEQGRNIAEAGQLATIIPPLFTYSIQLGYQRNELQDNLYSLSDMYAQQARTQQSRLQAILLPIMLIVVGGIIGVAILSLFMPIISLVSSMSS